MPERETSELQENWQEKLQWILDQLSSKEKKELLLLLAKEIIFLPEENWNSTKEEVHEWRETDRTACIVEDICKTPIPWSWWKFIYSVGLIQDIIWNEEKRFSFASHGINEEDVSKYRKWQKVWDINYEWERAATMKEKLDGVLRNWEYDETVTEYKTEVLPRE